MTADDPRGPLVGANDVIFGDTLNDNALVAGPASLCTVICPLVAPSGTVNRNDADDTRWKTVTLMPLSSSALTESRLAPDTVTTVPTGPFAGVKPEIVGGSETTKFATLVPVPSGVVTEILPVTAVDGTVNVSVLSSTGVNVAETDPTLTAVAPVKLEPLTVTDVVPRTPLVGVNDVIFGETLNVPALGAEVPAGDVTVIFPLVAPAGTVKRSDVDETCVIVPTS